MVPAEIEERPSKRVKATAIPLKSAMKKQKIPSTPVSAVSKSSNLDAKKRSIASQNAQSTEIPRRARTPPRAKDVKKVDKGKANCESESTSNDHPAAFKVIAGTYEKLLYGLEGSFAREDGTTNDKPTLKPIFIFPAHAGCIKAVAASPGGGKWLATGSTDEIIKVWDLRRRKEVGDLIQHEGSITYLDFPTRTHLVSASEDGTICIFHARDWVLVRSLKGHKGRVNSFAMHPSGKVGLSVGKDRTLRMWDLIRGKGSASTKLGKEGEIVRWSTGGSRFVVQTGSTMDVYSTNMSLLHTVTHPKRVQDVHFYEAISGDEYLLVASEDKKVTIYGTKSEDNTLLPVVAEAIGHDNRVKAIDTLVVATSHAHSDKSWTTIMSTASSDGWIRIFDLGALDSPNMTNAEGIKLEAIAAYDTKGSRITCCTLADGEASVARSTGKRKHEGDTKDESGEMEGVVHEEEEETDGSSEAENNVGDS